MNIDSSYPVWHRCLLPRSGERATVTFNQGRGLSPLLQEESTTHQLFGSSRTLQIRQIIGLGSSIATSILPLRAILFCRGSEQFSWSFAGRRPGSTN